MTTTTRLTSRRARLAPGSRRSTSYGISSLTRSWPRATPHNQTRRSQNSSAFSSTVRHSVPSYESAADQLFPESLFSAATSPERKYWGFQIFQKVLPRVGEADIPMLFTKNFMRSWINHLSNSDRYLHKAAKQVVSLVIVCGQRVNDNTALGERHTGCRQEQPHGRVHADSAAHGRAREPPV